ncbi:hypothetical protein VPH35_020275 [Triticum aestivum]
MAMLMVVERFVDRMVSWLPMYGEVKLMLVLYLWHHNTRGAGHVYDGFLRPLVARHEDNIDQCLLELRARVRDVTASQGRLLSVRCGSSRLPNVFRHSCRSRDQSVQAPHIDE